MGSRLTSTLKSGVDDPVDDAINDRSRDDQHDGKQPLGDASEFIVCAHAHRVTDSLRFRYSLFNPDHGCADPIDGAETRRCCWKIDLAAAVNSVIH